MKIRINELLKIIKTVFKMKNLITCSVCSFTTKWTDCDYTTYILNKGIEGIATCIVNYYGDNKKQAYLWNLQVKEEYRKCGIASQLMDKVCQDAKTRGCKEISLEWEAEESDGWVLDWYKRLGFKVDFEEKDTPFSIILVKKLK